jgi:biopolymer transport protein ExbD
MTLRSFRSAVLSVTFPVTMVGMAVVVLVFFVTITPVEDPFEAGLPYAETADALPNPFAGVAVHVGDDGFAQVERLRVSALDAADAVRWWSRRREPVWVIVSGDSCLPYGAVKGVLNQLAESGIARITLRTAKMRPQEATP